MARTTVLKVREILPTDTTLTDVQIQAAIDAASCAVDQIATGCASHLSEDCLTIIETYLSAHFASVTENTLSLSSEKDGCCDSSVIYGFQFGEGIRGTPFGQMANTISGGCLAELDNKPARIFSIGCI